MKHLVIRNLVLIPVITVAISEGISAQPAVTAVLNAASFTATVSPGSWVTIFGKNLADAPLTPPSASLPTSLGGVSVTVGGLSAPLSYISPDQVNAFIPFETAIPTNTVVPLVLISAGGSNTYNIRLTRDAPAIFTLNSAGTGRAVVFTPDLRDVTAIASQDSIVFYATGLGPIDATGRVLDDLQVYLGERLASVQSIAPIPGLPGIYQVRITAPLPATDRLYLRSGGWQSNIVSVPIHAGSNISNVTGTIDGLYPSSDPFFTLPICTSDDPNSPPCSSGQDLSVMLHAGRFSVTFDILPAAGHIDVAAVGEAGSVIISIDPASGKYGATITVPDSRSRFGDFQASVVPLWDYLSCSPLAAVCLSFPGPSVIPLARLSPFWVQATQSLPGPNNIPDIGSGPNGVFQSIGSIAGSHFAIDAQNTGGLSKFGGFLQVPFGPFDKRLSTFKLYVDGKLVASKDLSYTVTHR